MILDVTEPSAKAIINNIRVLAFCESTQRQSAFAFFLASMKTNPISQQISEYIHAQFEVEFFAVAITMLALAIALLEVYRRSSIIEHR